MLSRTSESPFHKSFIATTIYKLIWAIVEILPQMVTFPPPPSKSMIILEFSIIVSVLYVCAVCAVCT